MEPGQQADCVSAGAIAALHGLWQHAAGGGARAGGAPELKATSIDNNVGPPVFSADGKSLLTTVTDDRVVYVEEAPLEGGAPKRVTTERGVASALSQAGGHVALLWSTDSSDPEIYCLDGTRSAQADLAQRCAAGATHTGDDGRYRRRARTAPRCMAC